MLSLFKQKQIATESHGKNGHNTATAISVWFRGYIQNYDLTEKMRVEEARRTTIT
jgi:hypothetical protein